MTDLLEPREIGRDHARRDGAQKVRGTATYAYETPVDAPAFASIVQSTVARGRVTSVDTTRAEALDGVLVVLTTRNAERLASTDDAELAVLQGDEIAFRGQPVAVAVAETSEVARQAAELVCPEIRAPVVAARVYLATRVLVEAVLHLGRVVVHAINLRSNCLRNDRRIFPSGRPTTIAKQFASAMRWQ